jgi:NAD(P)-dependent dehydrogenase (short-subunit alcohol dehydrogenase family)
LANFSKGLAALGKRDGVNVNAIHPGATDTERTQQLLAWISTDRNSTDAGSAKGFI